jgi:2-C-methyl-D-erythritol 4-phosphate cytidylyltransferase
VAGGERRRDSVRAGLDVLECDIVCIHDAARPLCPPELFGSVVAAAKEHGAATAAIPCVDTIKEVRDGMVLATLDRRTLVAVQTPQAFARDLLMRAHAQDDSDASDDCVLVERLGAPVAVVAGDARNRKITTAEDIAWLRHEVTR